MKQKSKKCLSLLLLVLILVVSVTTDNSAELSVQTYDERVLSNFSIFSDDDTHE